MTGDDLSVTLSIQHPESQVSAGRHQSCINFKNKVKRGKQ